MFTGSAATLPAADMDRAKAFYRDVLGLEPFEEQPDGSARYQVGDTMFLLYPSAFAGTNRATAMGLGVDDLEAVMATLRDRGVEFHEFDFGETATANGVLTMPDGSRGSFFSDSEGNTIGLVQEA